MEDGEEIAAGALLLATGKHELRGVERGVPIAEAPLGLRASVRGEPDLDGLVELHLFDGGYAGLLLQEDGAANLCLSVSRARLKDAGGIDALVAMLSRELPALGARIGDGPSAPWSAVAGIPYGWRGRTTSPGLYRVGDQAAVIASIAGDGIAIALESGIAAGDAILAGTASGAFQHEFARRSARPVRLAEALRRSAERGVTRALLVALFGLAPGLASRLARLTRIAG
jgi:flavin-dependent dehydrogenase